MRADLQAANTVVQQMEIDMMKKDSDLVAQKQEVENLTNIFKTMGNNCYF